jgi:hypothetical protein
MYFQKKKTNFFSLLNIFQSVPIKLTYFLILALLVSVFILYSKTLQNCNLIIFFVKFIIKIFTPF